MALDRMTFALLGRNYLWQWVAPIVLSRTILQTRTTETEVSQNLFSGILCFVAIIVP
jgi:hypothetical protein